VETGGVGDGESLGHPADQSFIAQLRERSRDDLANGTDGIREILLCGVNDPGPALAHGQIEEVAGDALPHRQKEVLREHALSHEQVADDDLADPEGGGGMPGHERAELEWHDVHELGGSHRRERKTLGGDSGRRDRARQAHDVARTRVVDRHLPVLGRLHVDADQALGDNSEDWLLNLDRVAWSEVLLVRGREDLVPDVHRERREETGFPGGQRARR
jgi:hypothetical protein